MYATPTVNATKKASLLVFLFCSLFSLVVTTSSATNYFVNSITGLDANNGTSIAIAWKTLTPLAAKTFQPGDTINFARGSSWSVSKYDNLFLIDDNGTASQPIVFTAYGTGDLPIFKNTGNKYNQGIKISANYITVEYLKVATGYSGFDITAGSSYNIIRNCEVTGCGTGIYLHGSYNLLTKNYLHDLIMVVDDVTPNNDYGCVSFWLYAPYNEISYNTCSNNVGHSYDYQYDGGFLEFYDNCDNTYAHHNWVEKGVGLMEASIGNNGHATNVVVSYNVFMENLGFFAPHYTLTNFKFENNTCITKMGTLYSDMLSTVTGMVVRNNIFVYGGDVNGKVAKTNNFTHQNNLYYLIGGTTLGSLALVSNEKVGDPLFVNEAAQNFRLQAASPAKDAGVNLNYTIDFVGNPVGTLPDMGAYEYVAPLPIQLLSFKGEFFDNAVSLLWETVSQTNGAKFIIEKSIDAVSFTPIGEVALTNNINGSKYSFIDKTPFTDLSFYRLKMVDSDRTFKFSNTIILQTKFGIGNSFTIYPNPVTTKFTVTHPAATKAATLSIFMLDGKKILEIAIPEGATKNIMLADKLGHGHYRLVYKNDNQIVSTPFIK